MAIFVQVIRYLFAILFSVIGLINTIWGNDPFYGVFVILLSLPFYPVFSERFVKQIRTWHLIILGGLILWTALGVAELFDKIALMIQSFS
ncbi:MAG: hypothetical protein VW010_08130 [Flavobacteriaceae bacterium]|jgi:hypothetical protein